MCAHQVVEAFLRGADEGFNGVVEGELELGDGGREAISIGTEEGARGTLLDAMEARMNSFIRNVGAPVHTGVFA